MQLYTINTGFFKLDGGAMFGVVPKSIWTKLNAADENNLCSWALRCLLIEDGNRLILIDNGVGNKQDAKFFAHYYLHGDDSLQKSLRAHGFTEDDVTDVILTHLHFDHCGGSVSRENGRLLPAFKKATYWSNQRHWKWATAPNDREKASFLKENILPLEESGQLQFLPAAADAEGKLRTVKFNESISLRHVNGHTDSMMIPQIRCNHGVLVFAADLLPSVAHLPIPYIMAYDMFPLTSLQEKKIFLNEAVENNYILFFEHDPQHECCSLQRTERGVRQKEVFTLKEASLS